MNVVFLSDHASHGGAAVAANGVIRSVMQVDAHASGHHIAFFADGDARTLHSLWYHEGTVARQIYRLPRKVLPRWFPRPHTPEFAARRLRALLAELRPDIINAHNLHAATPWGWGPHLIEVCLEFAPVVWTLHDMWSFTGRCAYSYDCRRFITGCDASCPTATESPALAADHIRAAWQERRDIYARHPRDLVIVTPSRWLAQEARAGLFARHRVEVIPYGVALPEPFVGQAFQPDGTRNRQDCQAGKPDGTRNRQDCQAGKPDLHEPITRAAARRALGIAPFGPVLLVAAVDLSERRKGSAILPAVWRHVQTRPITVLTMGNGNVTIDEPGIEVHSLGYIEDATRKSLAYAAADALLHPAPVDNLPNVVLEALACGTPAIALPVGGLPELVRPGVSGWLADDATPAALAAAIDRALGDSADLRESCRQLIVAEFSLARQGHQYFQLFQQLQRRPNHATIEFAGTAAFPKHS